MRKPLLVSSLPILLAAATMVACAQDPTPQNGETNTPTASPADRWGTVIEAPPGAEPFTATTVLLTEPPPFAEP
jgi:hypothetical protein